MAKTPKSSPRLSRASPATVGKVTKKNNNLINGLKVEADASKSIVSSICTPRRMTRSLAKGKNELMLPPSSPTLTKKKKVETSNKKLPAEKQETLENEAKKSVDKVRKSMKLLIVPTETDSDDGLTAENMSAKETPIETPIKIEKDIKTKPKSVSAKKAVRQSLRKPEVEPELNTTFEMEAEDEDITQETVPESAGKKSNAMKRISVIDLTESPVVKKSTSALNTTFSPLANILEEDDDKIPVNDGTFTEEAQEIEAPTMKTAPKLKSKKATPKSAKKTSPKVFKKLSPKLKRLQTKTPLKKIVPQKAQTPSVGIQKPKPMSSVKKVKIMEAVKDAIGSVKKTKSDETMEAEKSSPFRFGATGNKPRGFNFNLKGTKIPTWKNNKKKKRIPNQSQKKAIPNFKAIHERMFEKELALVDVEKHKNKRANFIQSNKKSSNEENIFKPAQPKSKRKLELNMATAKVEAPKSVAIKAKPLAPMNDRAKLNGEQREERRKQMFKKSGKRQQADPVDQKYKIKGVRTNRRFDLMMENRFKLKN